MKLFQKKELPIEIVALLQQIREKSEILSICPQPTGYSWLGVRTASLSLFPDCTFQIPQYYSNQSLSDLQLISLASLINDLQFKQIIFNGYLPYFDKVIDLLINANVKIVYHGFFSELSLVPSYIPVFKSMIELAQKKKVKAIGFVKKGMALSMSRLFDIKTFEIILPNKNIIDYKNKKKSDAINIGCLVNTSYRKNVQNQAVAALMVNNSILHVCETKELMYLPQERIVYHPLLDHEDFMQILSQMTINLHVTFSESWGQVLSESISLGVPCISAYTSSFFDYDEFLKNALVVDGFDDSYHIYKKIEDVLLDLDEISIRCTYYAKYLDKLANQRLMDFISY